MLICRPKTDFIATFCIRKLMASTRLAFNETHTVTISRSKHNITQIILNILKIGKVHQRQFHKAYITRQIQVTHKRLEARKPFCSFYWHVFRFIRHKHRQIPLHFPLTCRECELIFHQRSEEIGQSREKQLIYKASNSKLLFQPLNTITVEQHTRKYGLL